MTKEGNAKRLHSRPRSIGLLAGLQMAQSIGFMVFGVMQVIDDGGLLLDFSQAVDVLLISLFEQVTSGVGFIILALLTFIVSIEILRMRRWAWLVSMTLQGIGLAVNLLGYYRGEPNYISMFLGILLVFSLNQQEVQDAFRIRQMEV